VFGQVNNGIQTPVPSLGLNTQLSSSFGL